MEQHTTSVGDTNNVKFREINQKDLKSFLDQRVSNKGIMLMGNTGVGKTYSIENFYLPHVKKGHEVSAYDLYQEAIINGPTFINKYLTHDLFIDDLGAEPKEVYYFGTLFSPMEMLLHERYKLYPEFKTSISTNLNMIDEIPARYGQRIASRLEEICDLVIVDGQDLRAK
jgi:DNA replication protein DnaC